MRNFKKPNLLELDVPFKSIELPSLHQMSAFRENIEVKLIALPIYHCTQFLTESYLLIHSKKKKQPDEENKTEQSFVLL